MLEHVNGLHGEAIREEVKASLCVGGRGNMLGCHDVACWSRRHDHAEAWWSAVLSWPGSGRNMVCWVAVAAYVLARNQSHAWKEKGRSSAALCMDKTKTMQEGWSNGLTCLGACKNNRGERLWGRHTRARAEAGGRKPCGSWINSWVAGEKELGLRVGAV